jgi:arylsulfatase A-like enzyme
LARELRLPVPASAQVAGDNSLELRVARHREPLASDADRRPLGIAVTALEVGPLGGAGPRGVPALDAGQLVLTPGSSASWYVRLEPGARLRLTSRSGAGGEGRLGVRLETDQAGERVVRPPGAAGESERLELPATPGMLARLEVANPGDGLVFVEELRLERDPIRETAPGALAKRPGVLIYLVDTLRADRLGIYGHSAPTSPRLDALAAEALVFEDAWGQASWTRPATASILTGLHPSRHGADREDTALAPEQLTLAERLGAAGYRTGAFVANHLVGGRFGFDQGFDTWNGGDRGLYGAPARQLGERALQWLDAGQGPFLLYVHTMEPHSPYDPPAEAMAPFELPDYEGDRDTRALLRLGQLGELSPEGLRFLEARYAGEIRANDDAFGQLLDGLASRGLLDSTVVVFISDHGEELLDHGGTEHAKTLYQELVRIPLLIRLPGGERRSGRIAEPVQQIDLLPSLLALAGLEVPPDLPGRDLSASWLGDASSTRPAPLLFAEERFTVTDKLAVRNGPLKLILNNDGPELWRAGTHVELYDLAADPGERHNLAATRPIAEAFLRQELERFRRQQAARSSDATPLELTPEELEQLRALGYVQ